MNILIGIIMCILNFFIAYSGVLLWDKIQSEADSQTSSITELNVQENIYTPSFSSETPPALDDMKLAPALNAEIKPTPVVEVPPQVVAPTPVVEVPAQVVEPKPVIEPKPVVEEPAPVIEASVPPQNSPAPAMQDSVNKMFNDNSKTQKSTPDKYKNMETQHSDILNSIDRLMQ